MSMFTSAKVIETQNKSDKKSKKKQVEMRGLKNLAEVDALIKALTTVRATLDSKIKDEGRNQFIKMAIGQGRPDNFTGTDGAATASIEMRKRSVTSVLSSDELNVLGEYGIQGEKEVLQPRMFAINPEYANDNKLLEKVEKALSKIVPKDFIVLQEEHSRYVVTDKMIDTIFAKAHPNSELVDIATTMAVKAKIENPDMSKILTSVKKLLGI